ncbi:hypothetical protein EDC18_11252 [Natranaerovirga pectinivora]|uniref:Uncharacterized protein n=1 Tax=Natranaerovirga pectinivora TaxID=682400 RepID=A0A4R3MGN1_9FIRM|nr:hypothetical protein [Natranaerovirga pectinivora]TCT12280.1 hypothetical protein EDC18_11252 [Natranaerovirga pectinivora]
MLDGLIKGQVINIIIILVGIVGIIALLISNTVYSTLLKESKDVGFSESKLLKNIKLKYENCYKLELYIHEVEAFIDKNLYGKKIFKIPIYFWENIALETMYICMILGFLGSLINVTYYIQNNILPIINGLIPGIVGFTMATVLLIIKTFVAVETKKNVFYSNVKDYLQNILKNKLDQQSKKEGIYEDYKKMEEMAIESSKNKKDISNNKKDNKSFDNNTRHISNYDKKSKYKSKDIIEEDFIDDIINEIIG